MWRAIIGIASVIYFTSTIWAQQTWQEVNQTLSSRESAFTRWRTVWQVGEREQASKLTIQPFSGGYQLSLTFPSTGTPSEARQMVLLREQPYAYFCQMLGGVVVQHLTWVHGANFLPYLTGVSLLRYIDSEATVETIQKDNLIYIVGTLRKDFPLIVPRLTVREGIEVVIDPNRGNAITQARLFFGTVSQVMEKLEVTEWQKRGHLWVPSTVRIERKGSAPLVLRLVSQEPVSGEPPAWFRPPLWVSDWRLGITKSEVVSYEYKDKLPSLEELQKLRRAPRKNNAPATVGGQTRHPWGSVIPPMILIAVSSIWYWRLRVKKVT